jgi:hypothetical protein
LQAQFASLRTELLQRFADHIEEVTQPLRDKVAAIKIWLARAIGCWERAKAASTSGVGCTPVRAPDAGLLDAKLTELFGPFSLVHRVCGSPLVGVDDIHLPPESLSPDALEDNVASLVGLQGSISDDVGGFGLAEFFVEAHVSQSLEQPRLEVSVFDLQNGIDELVISSLGPSVVEPEVTNSILHELSEEIPAVPSTVATEGIQVVSDDPVADKRNAFLSLVFRPLPPPILATPGPRGARAPMEEASTPRRSGRIEKLKLKRKDATTQELLTHALGLLEENAEFDGNVVASFIDKFKNPLSPWSITTLGSLVKKIEKVKNLNVERSKPRRRRLRLQATEIT